MIKISIIVPVYNMEKYLEKCILSLINQTLKEIEIIFIDDESKDSSLKILKGYAKKDDRIKIITQKNSGQGIARNKGIEIAAGEYIAFVDSDDYIELDMMEKMYQKAKKEKAEICMCNQRKVDENYQEMEIETLDIKGEYGSCRDNTNILFTNMGPCNKIFKTELIKKEQLLFPSNERMWYEDLPFVAAAIISAKKICWLNEAYYNYLQRTNSTMNNSNIEKNLDIIKSFEILKKNISKKNVNKKLEEEIEFLCLDHVYLFSSVRVIKIKDSYKRKKEVLNKLKEYIKSNYPNYKKNKYIKTLSTKRKIIFYLLNLKLYNIIYLIFFIKEKQKKV